MRVHNINNVNRVLDVLAKQYSVRVFFFLMKRLTNSQINIFEVMSGNAILLAGLVHIKGLTIQGLFSLSQGAVNRPHSQSKISSFFPISKKIPSSETIADV